MVLSMVASVPWCIVWFSLLPLAGCLSKVNINHDGQVSVIRTEKGKRDSEVGAASAETIVRPRASVIAKAGILEKMKEGYETNALKLRGPWPAYFNSHDFKHMCTERFNKAHLHKTGLVDIMGLVANMEEDTGSDPLLAELRHHTTQVDKSEFLQMMKYVYSRIAWVSLPAMVAAADMWRQRIIGGTILVVLVSFTLFIIGLRSTTSHEKPPLADPVMSERLGLEWLPNGRTLSFVLIWLVIGLAAAGFAPAFVLKLLGHPWYSDGARQIGPNAFQGATSFHAYAGTAWLAVLLHQTVTAYRGGQSAEFRQSSHRMVGRVGAIVALVASVSGIYLQAGSKISRLPEYLPMTLCGVYVVGNVFFGILHVRRGNILAHKQNMAWAIAFAVWPGIVRAANFGWYMFAGKRCPTQCLNQLAFQAPDFCSIMSFAVDTDCGMGYVAPKIAWLSSWVFGFVLWLLWGRGHLEILVGNSIGFMLGPFAGNLLKNAASSIVIGSASRVCKVCL